MRLSTRSRRPVPASGPSASRSVLRSAGLAGGALAGLVLALGACGGSASGGGGGQSGIVGQEVSKAPGETFFVSENRGGDANRLVLERLVWGRLVDIYDLDGDEPVFENFLINENIQTNVVYEFPEPAGGPKLEDYDPANNKFGSGDYLLETHPITQKTRLVIQESHDSVNLANNEVPVARPWRRAPISFNTLLKDAAANLPEIDPINDDGSSPPPPTHVPRNAAIALEFNDLLDDNASAAVNLSRTVLVRAGYPPEVPFDARILFDPNYGALAGGAFHSTRVLIDLAVSPTESAAVVPPLRINVAGLPPASTATAQPNLSIRIPSLTHVGSGQLRVLTNRSGNALSPDPALNVVVDTTSPTRDVVRGIRGGGPSDPNNGFLLDRVGPEVVGGWPVTVGAPAGGPVDFTADLTFPAGSPCQDRPDLLDVVQVGAVFLEVVETAADPTLGVYQGVQLRLVSGEVNNASDLAGVATFLTPEKGKRDLGRLLDDPATPGMPPIPTACWLSFTPDAKTAPATQVPNGAQLFLRFSEPIDPVSMRALDQFMVVRGTAADAESLAENGMPLPANAIVIGETTFANSLDLFVFRPVEPFAHAAGMPDPYHVELTRATDLAGNGLVDDLPFADFTLDPAESPQMNGGIALRFFAVDELDEVNGVDDFESLRGQITYDTDRGILFPRGALRASYSVDRSHAVPALMPALVGGTSAPLSPLGAKVQTVWRYCDFGWANADETKFNIDVVGMSWSPVTGLPQGDFFEQFEISLAHSAYLPDLDMIASGLLGGPNKFTENVLDNPLTKAKVVHQRGLGYRIDSNDLFADPVTGTFLMPFPWNQGAQPETAFTWRDTSILSVGGPNGYGIPMAEEANAGVLPTGLPAGSTAPAGSVPSFGLPLLIEFRCYPTSSGVGMNLLDANMGIFGGPPAGPAFRAYSAGGADPTAPDGSRKVNPDLEFEPHGAPGFNPFTGAPITLPSADAVTYIGRIDTVIRVSRAHTVWMNTGVATPTYLDPVIEPSLAEQPAGTNILIDYRTATGFTGSGSGTTPFRADRHDAYGNFIFITPTVNNLSGWTNDISDASGAQYLQARFTFVNNVETRLTPVLSGFGFAFLTN